MTENRNKEKERDQTTKQLIFPSARMDIAAEVMVSLND